MSNTKTLTVTRELRSTLEEAKEVESKLEALIEEAEILSDEKLVKGLRRAEKDVKEGRVTRISSTKELDDFFK